MHSLSNALNLFRHITTNVLFKTKLLSFITIAKEIKVYSRLQTAEIMRSRSIARYGDGEFYIIFHKQGISFQEYSIDLDKRLQEILYSKSDTCLVSIPGFSKDIPNLKNKDFWVKWYIENKSNLKKYLQSDYIYGDSFITRLYLPWIDNSEDYEIINILKSIINNKDIVMVEGEKTCWGVGNDLLDNANSVKRILCPQKNAYSKYEEILESCLLNAKPGMVFIIALGPTGTVLAYDLNKNGYHSLDLGHLDLQYEYLIRESNEREDIQYKYNNELNTDNTEDCNDDVYLNSIISRI